VPNLIPALVGLADGLLLAAPGAVLVRDAAGSLLGSLGVSGGAAEDDEAVAIAAVRAAGLVPEPNP
ncbi:MAG: heme-binding protein, partial [Pseudomonadota bacterium]